MAETTTKQITKNRGRNDMPSLRPEYFNSPLRAKKIKDAIERLTTYSLITKDRLPTRDEKSSFIYLGFPLERENNK